MTNKLQRQTFTEEARERFALLIMRRLNPSGLRHVQYDDVRFVINIFHDDGTLSTSIMLDDAFAEYTSAEFTERTKIIQRYASLTETYGTVPPTSAIIAIPNLLPRVAPLMLLQSMEATAQLQYAAVGKKGTAPKQIPHQMLSGKHCVSIVYDFPTHVIAIDENLLAGWGISFADACDIAVKNLHKLSLQPFEPVSDGLYASPHGDSHDASRILLVDKIRSECRISGTPVALLLNRDTLLIADSEKSAALKSACAIATQLMNEDGDYPVFPLILEGDHWQEYRPNEFDPLYEQFQHLEELSVKRMLD